MTRERVRMGCGDADELAAAYAVGALDSDEERAVSAHLAACDQPHAEARGLIEAAALLPVSLEPVEPSPDLRRRIMASVTATSQERAAGAAQAAPMTRVERAPTPRRAWWSLRALPSAIAAVAVGIAVGVGAWSVSLNAQLAEREEMLRAVASADTAYSVSGSAGEGWVMEADGQAVFLADDLADLPADRLYELWLIGPEGTPTAVGTLTATDGVAVVALEQPLGSAVTFAVTVEAERVDAPTTEPVLVAALEG